MTELPPPRTVTDELLLAIHDRLGELLDRLPARQESAPAGPGQVDIKEPAPAAARPAKKTTAASAPSTSG